MNVFVSSVIEGYQDCRQAAKDALDYLRKTHGWDLETIMAEVDFPSMTSSSQASCLQAVTNSDLYVILLGSRYGWVNPKSGLSATHEEYRTAVATGKPILAFVEAVKRESIQQEFVNEVSDYVEGVFRRSFENVDGLRAAVEHSVHHFIRTNVIPEPTTIPIKSGASVQHVTNYGKGAIIAQHIHQITIGGRRSK
jgi:hypothetical protein